MRKRESSMFIVLAMVIVVSLGVSAGPNAPEPAAQEQPKKVRAVWALRAINTAELTYQRAHGRYGTFGELVASGQFAALKGQWSEPFAKADAATTEADAVPGYKLRIVVAVDGAAYSVRIVDGESCGASFFSDEAGVIFQGQAIGCEVSAQASR